MKLHRWAALLLLALPGLTCADDWPQWLGPQRDGIWRESQITRSLPSVPQFRWKTPIGAGYAGPAVADGKVYVADRILAPEAKNPKNSFSAAVIPGKERIHRLDAATGKIEWTHEYDCPYRVSFASGPRCTPLVADGKVYTLGTMGHLFCLNASTGKPIWQRNLMKDYDAPAQTWGFSAHPLLDGNRLICLVGGSASVVAFDKDTGKEIWQSMAVRNVGYSPPVIYTIAGRRQLIIWDPESVSGLDPITGKVIWSQDFRLHQSNLSIAMPRLSGDRLLVTSFYNGPMLLKVGADSARMVWKGKSNSERANRTDKLHSIIPTPIIRDGYIYGICSYGQLRCLKLDTGERVWESMRATRTTKNGAMFPEDPKPTDDDRWGNAFITPQGDRDWLFNEHGELILAKLTPAGYEEFGRMKIIEADNQMANHAVVWSHPAYAGRCCFARNDAEIVCVDLSAK